MQTLEGHKKFVQGVATHPQLKLIASASSDATMRIYKNRKLKNQQQFFHKFTVKSRDETVKASASKDTTPKQEDEKADDTVDLDASKAEVKKKSQRLFLDDLEYQAFARRLTWSPDGSLLLVPAAQS